MTSKVDLDRVLGLALRHIRKEYHVDHVWNNVEEILKLRQPCKNEKTEKTMQVQVIDQTTHPPKCQSFVGLDREIGSSPPARSGSCTSIQMLHTTHTHTHARPEPGQPWTARGRKKRTQTTGKRPKQRRGGEGKKQTSRTKLHGEMALTNAEQTLKPHNTFQRGTGENLGTKWGTSWWRGVKSNKS